MKKISITLAFCLVLSTLFLAPSKVLAQRQVSNQSAALVKEVEYDNDDREVTFDFRQRVTYTDPKVVITSADNSQNFQTTIVEQERDELTVRVEGLTRGETYNYTITGVSASRNGTAGTLTGTFKAIDRD